VKDRHQYTTPHATQSTYVFVVFDRSTRNVIVDAFNVSMDTFDTVDPSTVVLPVHTAFGVDAYPNPYPATASL
jgi:hypothetical protein